MKREADRALLLILALYLLLALGYGAVNPLFEAPDEHWHYFTAQFIAETGQLPAILNHPDPWMGQEAAQPPLYYLFVATLIGSFDTTQARDLIWFNPRVQLGDASSPANTNAFVHPPGEAWPWHGHVLAVHLARAFSALIGLGTLLCIYAAGRLVWPAHPRRALLATVMVAFLPQFAFLHGAISNDPLIIFLGSAAVWQLLRLWYSEASSTRLLLIGLTIGLAIITKMAGLLLLPYAAVFLATLAWRDNRNRPVPAVAASWLRRLALVAFPALLLGGPLLWRNWVLYGDPTATSEFIRLAGGDRGYTLLEVLGESDGLWTSMFAVFGWFNVRAPGWVYLVWNGLILAASGGILLDLVRRRKDVSSKETGMPAGLPESSPAAGRPWLPAVLLVIWVFMVYAGLVRFMLQTPAAQGRLMFPALLPLALGLAYGLSRYRWPGVYVIAPFLALLTSLFSLVATIPDAYARPPIIEVTAIPEEASRFDVDMGLGLELVAAHVETDVAKPGEWLWLTLYWRAREHPGGAANEAPEYVLELLGREDKVVGKTQSYHGGGLYPSSLWNNDEIVVDRTAVQLAERLATPVQVRFNAKLAGQQTSLDVGTAKVTPIEWPSLSSSSLAQLNGIELVEVSLEPGSIQSGESVRVNIRWQVISTPERGLTTFVHLGDPAEAPLAQGDSPPLSGSYPTYLWQAGEVFTDTYTIVVPPTLAPGLYPVHVGMYDPQTIERVPLAIDGRRQPFDAYPLGRLEVKP